MKPETNETEGGRRSLFGRIVYWFRNYFYYYKWTVIVVVFFVVVILFCATQSEGSNDYDVLILYTGPHFFETGEKPSLENAFSQILSEDVNGDGRKTVEIVDMPAFSDDEIRARVEESDDMLSYLPYAPYTYDQVKKTFSTQVFVGDTAICLLDPYWFEILKNSDGLVPLSDILGYRPDGAIDEYGVRFASLSFASFFEAAGRLPENTVICFRRMSTAAPFTGRRAIEKNYAASEQALRDIFAFSA